MAHRIPKTHVWTLALAGHVVLSAGLVGFPTAAQDVVAAPPTEQLNQSRAFFEQGVEFSTNARWRDALDAFEAAWSLAHRPAVAFNLATVRYRLGHYVRAKEALAAYFELSSPDEPLRAEAERLESLIARVLVRVTLHVSPENADLLVDGAVVTGSGPMRSFDVDPGSHAVQVQLAGRGNAEQRIVGKAGDQITVSISLGAVPRAQPLAAKPAALAPAVKPSRPWSAQRWLSVGTGTAGVVGLALSGVFVAVALTKNSDSKHDCDSQSVCGERGFQDRQSARRWGNAATATAVAGGALMLGAGILFFTADDRADFEVGASGMSLVPSFDGRRAELQLRARF